MTKKNAKKNAARARQEAFGGNYQNHLRQVGGAGRGLLIQAKIEPAVATQIAIVCKFDPTDLRNKTRTEAGAYKDPIRPLEIINGERVILVWIGPLPQGSAGWRLEVKHRTGPWPLQEEERSVLENWLEAFAKAEWPERTQIWPLDYTAARKAFEPMRKDVYYRSLGGVVDAHFATVRPNPEIGETFDHAFEELKQEVRDRPDLLAAEIRRADVPGHPQVCRWERETANDAWTFEWGTGADDDEAAPLTLTPASPRPSLAELLEKLRVPTAFGVLVTRATTAQGSASLGIARKNVLAAIERNKALPFTLESGKVTCSGTSEDAELLLANGAADDANVQILRSFENEHHVAFSAQCNNCRRWVWCGLGDHEAICFCGQSYRVIFDAPPDWTMHQGWACMDCGEANRLTEPQEGKNPWRPVNTWQGRCNLCASKATSRP